MGSNALYNNTVTYANTAIGYGALFNNGGDFGTAGGNTAIGFEALYNNTTGNSNIAVGSNAGFAVTTSSTFSASAHRARMWTTVAISRTFGSNPAVRNRSS